MTEQRVNWAEATPERNRSFWRTYLYGRRGSLWALAALGVLALFSFFYKKGSGWKAHGFNRGMQNPAAPQGAGC